MEKEEKIEENIEDHYELIKDNNKHQLILIHHIPKDQKSVTIKN